MLNAHNFDVNEFTKFRFSVVLPLEFEDNAHTRTFKVRDVKMRARMNFYVSDR